MAWLLPFAVGNALTDVHRCHKARFHCPSRSPAIASSRFLSLSLSHMLTHTHAHARYTRSTRYKLDRVVPSLSSTWTDSFTQGSLRGQRNSSCASLSCSKNDAPVLPRVFAVFSAAGRGPWNRVVRQAPDTGLTTSTNAVVRDPSLSLFYFSSSIFPPLF